MNKLKGKFIFFSAIAVCMIAFMMTSCEQEAITNGIDNATNPILDEQFKSYEIIEIDNETVWNTVESQIDGDVNLEMRKAGSDEVLNWSFNTTRVQVEADDFELNLVDANGQITAYEMPQTHVLSGQLKGDGTGEIFMGITKNNLRAEVIQGEDTYMIEPLTDYTLDAKPNQYVKYNVEDIIVTGEHTCGMDESQFEFEVEATENTNMEERAPNCLKVEVMFVGDYNLYARFGYNFDAAYNWMYWRVVYGGKRYYAYNGFQLNLIIKKGWLYTGNVTIATSSNATTYLQQWTNFANNNGSWIQRGDVNVLFTGKDTGGGTVGVAWLNSICNSYYSSQPPFTFVEYQNSTYLSNTTTAHEIGHILGAGHSSYGFMTANVTNANSDMSNYTRNQLNNWVWNNDYCLGWWGCEY